MTGFSKTIGFESGADGDALTLTNTNSDTLRLTTGAGTGTISTARAHSGTRSMRVVGGTTAGLYCVEDNLDTVSNWTEDLWISVVTLPSAEVILARLTDSAGTVVCKIGLNGVGALILRDSTGANLYSSPSGKRLTAGTAWYHIRFEAVAGATGSLRFRWWPVGAAEESPTDDSGVKAANNPTIFMSHRRGLKCESSNATGEVYFDDLTLVGASTLSGTAGSPASGIKGYKTASFTAVPSGGSGTYTYAWSQVGGPAAVAMTGTSTSTVTVTAPAVMTPTTLTLQCVLGDGTSTYTATVTMQVDTHPMWVQRSGVLVPVRAVIP